MRLVTCEIRLDAETDMVRRLRPKPERGRATRSRWSMAQMRVFEFERLEARLVPSVTPALVDDIDPLPLTTLPGNAFVDGSTLYLSGYDPSRGVQDLWKSDGTA